MGIINFIGGKCTQTAVYWGTPINDGRGKHTFTVVEEVSVRWEDEISNFTKDNRSRVRMDKDGKEYTPNATVFTSNLPTGGWDLDGYLYLGTLDDLDSAPQPYDTENAWEVKDIEVLPTLNDPTQKLYVIYL